MPTNNAINLNATGIAVYDGAGTFSGRTITAGAAVTVTNGNGTAGNPTIAVTGGGLPWTEVTAASVSLAVNNGYTMNRGTAITATLPAVAAIGDTIQLVGNGAGLTIIAQGAGQTIHIGASNTTTGAGGTLTATNRYDCITLTCITANTDFVAYGIQGNWTVV